MMASLESLPQEILCHIAGLTGRRKNLDAFSLVSKTSHAAAVPFIFSSIQFKVINIDNFQTDIEQWHSILERHAAHKFVRCLKVTKSKDSVATDPGAHRPTYFDLVDSDDEFANPPKRRLDTPSHWKFVDLSSEDIVWRRLSTLVQGLPALLDFYYDYSSPLPACLLSGLGPSCKLHHLNFWFWDYLRSGSRHPRELHLAMSPLLSSLRTRSLGYTSIGEGDFTHEGVIDLLRGLNPHITSVSMLTDLEGANDNMGRALQGRTSRGWWPGFDVPDLLELRRPAALCSLELGGSGPSSLELFVTLIEHCDMSHLKTLKLWVPYSHPGLQLLTTSANLGSLTTLILGLARTGIAAVGENACEENASRFITSLSSLVSLRLVGPVSEGLLKAILDTHGRSLRRLWFPPPSEELPPPANETEMAFTPEQVNEVQTSCRSLEELAITIPRSKGDGTETGMYRAIGAMPRLQKLVLTLDCEDTALDLSAENDDPTPVYSSFDDFDTEFFTEDWVPRTVGQYRDPRNGHIRDAMINRALDKELAISIFKMIQNAKPVGAVPLDHLELRPVRGIYCHAGDDLMQYIAMWWLLVRDERDDRCHEVVAKKLRDHGDYKVERSGPLYGPDPDLAPIFRKLWPSKTGRDEDWTSDWHGWALTS